MMVNSIIPIVYLCTSTVVRHGTNTITKEHVNNSVVILTQKTYPTDFLKNRVRKNRMFYIEL